MPVNLKSTDVQQNFGQAIDRAMLEEDVIVERYGMPRVAIVEYQRYRRLVEAVRALMLARLQQASTAASALAERLSEAEYLVIVDEDILILERLGDVRIVMPWEFVEAVRSSWLDWGLGNGDWLSSD